MSLPAKTDKPCNEMTEMVTSHGKRIIEALLFSTNTPLEVARIRSIVDKFYNFSSTEIITLIHELKSEYEEEKRAFHIEEVSGGFILLSSEEYGEYVHELYKDRRGERLSQAAREVLSILALKGPVTRTQIEQVRGVDSSNVVLALVERDLAESKGQLETPGRPTLYGVTQTFLRHFGLKSCDDLKSFFENG